MGGHVGLLLNDDDNASTEGRLAHTTFDAFGNAMSPHSPCGSFAWLRGRRRRSE